MQSLLKRSSKFLLYAGVMVAGALFVFVGYVAGKGKPDGITTNAADLVAPEAEASHSLVGGDSTQVSSGDDGKGDDGDDGVSGASLLVSPHSTRDE